MRMLQAQRRVPGCNRLWLFLIWDVVRTTIWLWLKLQYRIKLIGEENVPREGPLVYVVNHQSHFDPLIVGVLVHDRPFISIARSTLYRSRIFSLFTSAVGTIPLDRESGGDKAAFKVALEQLKLGRCIFMFPEGTRTPDGSMWPFKNGVLLLLKRSRARAVPVALEGAYDIWPRGGSGPKGTGRIAVKAAPAIEYDELMCDGPEQALERLRRTIETMRLELREDLRRSSGGRYPAPGPGDEPYWERPDESWSVRTPGESKETNRGGPRRATEELEDP